MLLIVAMRFTTRMALLAQLAAPTGGGSEAPSWFPDAYAIAVDYATPGLALSVLHVIAVLVLLGVSASAIKRARDVSARTLHEGAR